MTATTATPTRTLADVYRERLAEADPDALDEAIFGAIRIMAPYRYDNADLRPSEAEWLGALAEEAAEHAKVAALDVIFTIYERELARLVPESGLYSGGSPADAAVPTDLWIHGGDTLREDLAALEAGR